MSDASLETAPPDCQVQAAAGKANCTQGLACLCWEHASRISKRTAASLLCVQDVLRLTEALQGREAIHGTNHQVELHSLELGQSSQVSDTSGTATSSRGEAAAANTSQQQVMHAAGKHRLGFARLDEAI